MICKLVFKKQIHLYSQLSTYKGLISFIHNSFSHLPHYFQLTYQDEQADEIMISSQDDVEVFALIHTSSKRFPKIKIIQAESVMMKNMAVGGEESFEVLEEEQIPEELKQEEEIARANQTKICKKVEKLVLKQQEMMRVVREESERRDRRIEKMFRELEEEMVQEEVKKYTCSLNRKIMKTIEKEEQEEIKDIARQNVDMITQRSIDRYLSLMESQSTFINPNPKPHRSKSSQPKGDAHVQKLVDKKLRQLIPSIIDKVANVIEQRLRRKYFDRANLTMLRQTYNIDNAEEEDYGMMRKQGGSKCHL